MPDSPVSKLEKHLRDSKFEIWKGISWVDGSELPLFAFRDVTLPLPQSQSLFLREVEVLSADDLEQFSKQCLKYIQRTKPTKFSQSRWVTQFVILPCIVADHFDDEVLGTVQDGSLSHRITSDMPFPVLINRQSNEVTYCRRTRFWGFAVYLIAQRLVRRLIID